MECQPAGLRDERARICTAIMDIDRSFDKVITNMKILLEKQLDIFEENGKNPPAWIGATINLLNDPNIAKPLLYIVNTIANGIK
jgi:hypothetical protein